MCALSKGEKPYAFGAPASLRSQAENYSFM